MAQVESILSTSFWAVPAFIRVEPVTASGPVRTTMAKSQARSRGVSGLQVRATAALPAFLAASTAPRTKAAPPAALMPTTTSWGRRTRPAMAARPASRLSSAPSTALRRAWSPPAMMPMTRSGSTP